jgi:hypothetical protein
MGPNTCDNLCSAAAPACVQVTGVMHSLIRSIPAFKWLLVLPQLTSRMCHVQPDVQVGGVCLHLLQHIMALTHRMKDVDCDAFHDTGNP